MAPADGQSPLFIMTDKMFEAMSNPDKFPYGPVGTFSSDRQWETKLTYRKNLNKFLKSSANSLGEIVYYGIRVEFQTS